MPDIGYYTLPVILSFKGIDAAVNKELGDKLKPAAKKAGEDYGKQVAEGVAKSAPEVKAAAEKAITKPVTEAAKKAGADVGKTLNKEVVKSTTGSGGLGRAAKGAAEEFGKGMLDGITREISKAGAGRKISDAIESVIGDVDISGPVNGIIGAIDPLKTSLEKFKTGDVEGGLRGTVGALESLEGIGIPPQLATSVGGVADAVGKFSDTKEGLDGVVSGLQGFSDSAPGMKGKIDPLITTLGSLTTGLALAAAAEGPTMDADKWGDENIPFIHWANQYTPDVLSKMASDRIKAFLDPLVADVEGTPGGPVGRFGLPQGTRPRPISADVTHPGRAGGGSITGPGGPMSDVIPIWASAGEHVLSAADVAKMGGQANVYAFRNMLQGFAGGGAVDNPDVLAAMGLVGTPYSQAARNDCSGMVARIINQALGMGGGGLMSTKTAQSWLAARGFIPGSGGPGQISVGWYDHGPNPNDGHMAMTLSNGQPAESGGSHGTFLVGAGAKGANSPQFDQHMYLPTLFGEGPAGPSSAAPSPAAGSIDTGAPAAPSTSSGGGSSSISFPSSLPELAAFGLADLGKGVGTTGSGSDLSLFGKAAETAVSGQVASALDVFGVPGSPGWLKGISTLVSGISIGGGGSAAPNAAQPAGTGTPPPGDAENMHGTRAGQQPGPGVTYNITARDTEDAFIRAQRQERERAAAKLSRF